MCISPTRRSLPSARWSTCSSGKSLTRHAWVRIETGRLRPWLSSCIARDGTFGSERWKAFLETFNDLMRARASVDSFFHMVDVLSLAGTPGRVGEIMELLGRARPHADSFRARLLDNPKTVPALDPLIPAIVQTVVHWSEDGGAVSIVHDEHNALTEERIEQLKEMFGKPRHAVPRHSPSGRLAGLRLVDSRLDPRVQVADFLAGVARKIASDELNDRGDGELVALLRPYVDASSTWGDERSWSLLGPSSRLGPPSA
jgi:hypothetical protein